VLALPVGGRDTMDHAYHHLCAINNIFRRIQRAVSVFSTNLYAIAYVHSIIFGTLADDHVSKRVIPGRGKINMIGKAYSPITMIPGEFQIFLHGRSSITISSVYVEVD
jgi:hypothetical protein